MPWKPASRKSWGGGKKPVEKKVVAPPVVTPTAEEKRLAETSLMEETARAQWSELMNVGAGGAPSAPTIVMGDAPPVEGTPIEGEPPPQIEYVELSDGTRILKSEFDKLPVQAQIVGRYSGITALRGELDRYAAAQTYKQEQAIKAWEDAKKQAEAAKSALTQSVNTQLKDSPELLPYFTEIDEEIKKSQDLLAEYATYYTDQQDIDAATARLQELEDYKNALMGAIAALPKKPINTTWTWDAKTGQFVQTPMGPTAPSEADMAILLEMDRVRTLFSEVFHEADVQKMVEMAADDPDSFILDMRYKGRSPEAVSLLKEMFPNITDDQIDEIYAPAPGPETRRITRQFNQYFPNVPIPQFEAWLSTHTGEAMMTLQKIGRNSDTEGFLREVAGFSDEQINDFFKPQFVGPMPNTLSVKDAFAQGLTGVTPAPSRNLAEKVIDIQVGFMNGITTFLKDTKIGTGVVAQAYDEFMTRARGNVLSGIANLLPDSQVAQKKAEIAARPGLSLSERNIALWRETNMPSLDSGLTLRLPVFGDVRISAGWKGVFELLDPTIAWAPVKVTGEAAKLAASSAARNAAKDIIKAEAVRLAAAAKKAAVDAVDIAAKNMSDEAAAKMATATLKVTKTMEAVAEKNIDNVDAAGLKKIAEVTEQLDTLVQKQELLNKAGAVSDNIAQGIDAKVKELEALTKDLPLEPKTPVKDVSPIRAVEPVTSQAPAPAPKPVVEQLPRNLESGRLIRQATEQVKQDATGRLTQFALKVPGIRQLMLFERPGLKMTGQNQKVLISMIAESSAKADVSVRALSTRLTLFNKIEAIFGKDSLKGGQVEIKFKGTPEQAKNPITGTLKDIADNPELYDLTPEQIKLLTEMEARNDALLELVTEKYGAEIGRFKAKGAFLPNVDISEDIIEHMGSQSRAASTGRGKTRVWQTARERMEGKTPFKPETDVRKLLEGLDNYKSSAAGGQTYRESIGGLTRLEAMKETHPALYERMTALRAKLSSLRNSLSTVEENATQAIDDFMASPVEDADLGTLRDNLEVKLKSGPRAGMDAPALQAEIDAVRAEIAELRPAWKAANLKPYVFVQEGVFRYFPADQAALIAESRKVTNNPLLNFIEKWRGQAFSGDTSPFAIQGSIGVLADPFGSVKAATGGIKSAIEHHDILRSVKVEALADDIADNLDEWSQYASLMGRQLSGTPEEYAAGFLSKIPGFDKFTESTYVSVTRGSFNLWQRTYQSMVKAGIPELEAKVSAANAASKVYPLVSAAKLGQSSARHSVLRALPTSYSFIRQPVTLMADATKGLGKVVTRQKLSPQESLAVKLVTTMAASTLTVSATSAAIDAMRKGEDAEGIRRAVWDAINPNPYNGKFASVIVAGKRIPIGGPYRSIFRAVFPQDVEGVPFPVPFAGLPTYLRNRVTPAIAAQLDLLLNKDYSGTQIVKGNFPENVLRGLGYELESVLPLTLGTVAESIRQGDRFKESIWQQVISQFMGVNAVTLDNTYNDQQIRKLGLPNDKWQPESFSIEQRPVYNAKDLWSDAGRALSARTGKGYDDKPLTKAIIEARAIKSNVDKIPNTKLIDLNADPMKNGEATDTFLEMYRRGELSQSDYALLREYYAAEDSKTFLQLHPELGVNKREEWLVANPIENAKLALFGQAKVLTQRAYDEVLRLAKELDIPENALPDFPPKDIAIDYFSWEKITETFDDQSPEAKLIVAKADLRTNGAMSKYLKRKPVETPIPALEIQVKNRDLNDAYDDLEDDKAREDFRIAHPEWVGDNKRIEAYNNGGEQFADLWAEHGKLVLSKGDSTAEDKLWFVDHKDVYDWAVKNELKTDSMKDWNIPVLRIDAKYREEDKAYDAIDPKAKTAPDGLTMREQYLKDNKAYADARRERDGYSLGLDASIIPQWVEYNSLPDYGAWRSRYRKEHPEFDAAVKKAQSNPWADLDDDIPAEPYDKIYEDFKDKFKAYDNVQGTEKEREAQREAMFEADAKFKEAWYRREAYGKLLPDVLTDIIVYDDKGNKQVTKGSMVDLFVRYSTQETFYGKQRLLLNNPEFDKLMDTDAPKSVIEPDYDIITKKYQAQFDELDKLKGDAYETRARELRFADGKYTEFGIAEITRNAYHAKVPKNLVPDYVAYYKIAGEKEATNKMLKDKWQKYEDAYNALATDAAKTGFLKNGTMDLPDIKGYARYRADQAVPNYEDDWFLMEHPDYYKNVYLNKDIFPDHGAKDFEKIPSREVFALYLRYRDLPLGSARTSYRRSNPDLEKWMVLQGWVQPLK